MKIEREETGNKGSFFILHNNQQVALMTYKIDEPATLVILHTEVDEMLKGQNVGRQLVEQAVQYARQNQLRIKPLCSFANAVLQKKKAEHADVLEQ